LPSVCEPATVAEAADVLGAAAREGRRVSIERDGGDVVLLTRRLDRLLEHEAGDLTVTVEAGMRLRELNERLATEGQRLSLDPPGDPTLGAVVAGDLSGPLAYRFGRPRDLLLGVTVVLADATVASAGGKVVKNVAGYDLGKAFCGSRGRLGLVARVSFRLHPLPPASRTLAVNVNGPQEAAALLATLLRSQLTPSAADLLWPGRLALLFEGTEHAVAAELDDARALLGGREDDGVWAEVAERQLAAGRRRVLAPADLAAELDALPQALVRLGPACYVFEGGEPLEWPPLAERVRAELDPAGVLA
jgi:glycolate oxidase FAD binding subunit